MPILKCVVTIVASGEIKRVHTVLVVACRQRAGVQGLVTRLVQAVDGLYSVKLFDEAEFHKAELGLPIGGA